MKVSDLPDSLPESGILEPAALKLVAGLAESGAARLGDPAALAHMDPPPPPIAATLAGLNAGLNQNLLHPDLSPFATEAERRVIAWLAPPFGMVTGQICAGSSIANLTALWCARESGARRVVASGDAHLSIRKAAHILAMPFEAVPVDAAGRLDPAHLPPTRDAVLVLTAGTTGRGVIDALGPAEAAWLHVDAAWAGPLRLTRHGARLDGIDHADSVAISAHKWLFQPKDSALILFADPAAPDAISFAGGYLAAPNVGVQGSRGAAAIPLLGTLLAWGRAGLAERIERCIAIGDDLAGRLAHDARVELKQFPETAVLTWRPSQGDPEATLGRLGRTASRTRIDGETWVRHAVANPFADIDLVWARIGAALG
ncbi:MAG TPA: aspartate aminotransferase family protein [Rhodobacteraceae bacterium]|jgi:L-2,4-diaminobutyrate decarboxylase|nr:aspartate aminotransferase family protein [Paracoccaceae bacterium]HBG97310.1 aspartate aminotransferase family protein [Paracoccaceae bacterium]